MFHVAFLSDRNATRIYIHPASPAGSYHNYLKAIPISFSPEAFHRSIIPAVSFSAHTAKKIMFTDQLPVFRCTVGGASIRVYDTAGLSASSQDHIIKCIHYKLFIVASAHRDPLRAYLYTDPEYRLRRVFPLSGRITVVSLTPPWWQLW